MLEQLILTKDTRIISTNAAEEWGSLKGQATGLEITERNYLSIGNVTKSFTFPPQFQPFWPANFGFLALTEVKKVPFRRKTSLQLLPFHHNFYLSRKGGKAVNSSPDRQGRPSDRHIAMLNKNRCNHWPTIHSLRKMSYLFTLKCGLCPHTRL